MIVNLIFSVSIEKKNKSYVYINLEKEIVNFLF